jgi:hypothetical protein
MNGVNGLLSSPELCGEIGGGILDLHLIDDAKLFSEVSFAVILLSCAHFDIVLFTRILLFCDLLEIDPFYLSMFGLQERWKLEKGICLVVGNI